MDLLAARPALSYSSETASAQGKTRCLSRVEYARLYAMTAPIHIHNKKDVLENKYVWNGLTNGGRAPSWVNPAVSFSFRFVPLAKHWKFVDDLNLLEKRPLTTPSTIQRDPADPERRSSEECKLSELIAFYHFGSGGAKLGRAELGVKQRMVVPLSAGARLREMERHIKCSTICPTTSNELGRAMLHQRWDFMCQ
ncbi:unnamed protein product [Merluccius merluccius]